MKTKAFTLVEIMIVVVIIGLLVAMAIPAFQKIREARAQKEAIAKLGRPEVKQIIIVSIDTGKIVLTSPLKDVIEHDRTHVKWTDTDGTIHEQTLDGGLTYHVTMR